jgi:hypothetical protein
VAYDTQAQEFVYGFYARGWSKERALPEIRKVYAGFSGSTWDEWVKKYDWPARRALADAKLRDFDDLYREAKKGLNDGTLKVAAKFGVLADPTYGGLIINVINTHAASYLAAA